MSGRQAQTMASAQLSGAALRSRSNAASMSSMARPTGFDDAQGWRRKCERANAAFDAAMREHHPERVQRTVERVGQAGGGSPAPRGTAPAASPGRATVPRKPARPAPKQDCAATGQSQEAQGAQEVQPARDGRPGGSAPPPQRMSGVCVAPPDSLRAKPGESRRADADFAAGLSVRRRGFLWWICDAHGRRVKGPYGARRIALGDLADLAVGGGRA